MGNLGDNFSHRGLTTLLKKKFFNIDLETVELRRFYQNASQNNLLFDNSFASLANSYDLVIIGGGGYFKQNFSQTSSATTFDFSKSFLNKLKAPLVFNSIGGVDNVSSNHPDNNDKFISFLNQIKKRENIVINLRNDGSKENILSIDKKFDFSNSFFSVLDCAFHSEFKIKGKKEKDYILINLGWDQVENLFNKSENFYELFSEFLLKTYSEKEIILRFIPHIYKDFKSISKVLDKMPDDFVRYKTEVCSLSFDYKSLINTAQNYLFANEIYAGRFHSNILGIKFKKKVTPLYRFKRVDDMYESITEDKGIKTSFKNLEFNYYDLSHRKFEKEMRDKIKMSEKNFNKALAKIIDE